MTNAPRFTGEVVVPLAVVFSTAAIVRNPPRGLVAGSRDAHGFSIVQLMAMWVRPDLRATGAAHALVRSLKAWAAEVGATSTAVAIAWVLARRGVTTIIMGPRTFDQYEQNMEGFDLRLDPSLVKRLSDASRWAR